ncbi:hypothetical protein GCM10007426_10800 [Alloalcanivorax dieselolei]|nr:hypothetical protein GCM10007426_10800 [Alloalcanivorax dieselolei]
MTRKPLVQAIALILAVGAGQSEAGQRPFSAEWFDSMRAGRAERAQRPSGHPHRPPPLAQQKRNREAQRSFERMTRTAASIAAQQAAARAAAKASANVPNGLVDGGLKVDTNALTAGWHNAEAPRQSRDGDRTEVTIKQTDKKAILNWETFNVGSKTTVNFDQSAGTDAKTGGNDWSALNRVNDPNGRPSEIAGRIKAEGGVYLINRNGIVFNGSSQVNVRNLVAASLKLSDEQFKAGINVRLGTERDDLGWVNGGSHHGLPTFGENPTEMSNRESIDTAGQPDGQVAAFEPGEAPGDVEVQAGALIEGKDGHVMLFAPKVRNHGEIRTPGGQTLMAAGENVWLEADETNPTVRGFDAVVSAVRPWTFNYGPAIGDRTYSTFEREIVSKVLPMMEQRAAEVGYSVTNTGLVQADYGDITLVSREINQNGILQASTALNNRDGSIRLRAWGQGMYGHGSSFEGNGDFDHLVAWSGGTVTLGENSVTQVVNDWEDATEIEISALPDRYRPGRIELYGKEIDIRPRASVTAAAGNIDLQAATNPYHFINGNRRNESAGDGSRILIGEDAYISTAGLLEMPVDMARNFVEVDLRINELKDSFLQHATWLYGKKVIVDRRVSGQFTDGPMAGVEWLTDSSGNAIKGAWVGTPLADVTGWVGTSLIDLAELASAGGNITVQAGGAVITRPGSILDVSGGSVRYSDGWNTTTQLLGADGRIHNISSAPTDMTYVGLAGVYERSHDRWGVTDTYTNPLISRPRYESSYVEGRDAGSITVRAGEAMILEGKLHGGVEPGDRAQELSDLAQAGSLTLGGAGNDDRPWTPGRVIISHTPVLLRKDFSIDSQIDGVFLAGQEEEDESPLSGSTTWLSDRALSDSGLGEITLNVTDGFTLEAGASVDLMPGTEFSARINSSNPEAVEMDILGSIRTPGGRIALGSLGTVNLGGSSVLDVGGQWVNDYADRSLTLGRAIHGGSVVLGRLGAVEQGAMVNLTGGGWLGWDGRDREAVLEAGDAGSLTLSGFDTAKLDALDLRAWSGADAAQLRINLTGDVQIGGTRPDAAREDAPVWLPGTLLGEYGFGAVTIYTDPGDIEVPEGAQVSVLPLGWNLTLAGETLAELDSGASLSEVLAAHRVEDRFRWGRAEGGLSLDTADGDIRLGVGSSIETEPGGTVTLTAGRDNTGASADNGNMVIEGRVLAPAGDFSAQAAGDLTLARGAQLLLPGAAQIFRDPTTQLRQGEVLVGGTVTLRAAGRLNAQDGALIDVSGARGTVEYRTGSPFASGALALRSTELELGSDGGGIEFEFGAEGGVLDSVLLAKAGSDDAAGGRLSIEDRSVGGASEEMLLSERLGSALWYESSPGTFTRIRTSSGNLNVFGDYGDEEITLDFVMLDALNTLPESSSTTKGLVVVEGSAQAAADDLTGTTEVTAWEYDPAIDRRVIDLLNQYFHFGSSREAGEKIQINPINRVSKAGTVVAASSIHEGGFADVALASQQTGIRLGSGVDLNVDGRLALAAPVIRSDGQGGLARLQANHVVLNATQNHAIDTNLAGTLHLSARQVMDIMGGQSAATIRGFERTVLETGDLRLLASTPDDDGYLSATLDVDGALEIAAAQVYPGTAVRGRIQSGEAITVRGNGQAGAPLSAGGSLTLSAPVIEQQGVLRAPFGDIVLDASDRLVLGAGSLTSVSGAGLIVPYGNLGNNEYWLDPANPQGRDRDNPRGEHTEENRYLSAPPEKRVTLQAPDVVMGDGAVVDVAGGGDLYAWEHVPGPGGSHDVLTLPGMYAVRPGYQGLSPEAGEGAGRQVWLAGGDGLEAGWYTLLPAHHALLPGAFAVQATGAIWRDSAATGPSATLRDGSLLMQGRERDDISGAQDPVSSAWRVMSGDLVRRYSEYNEAFGNDFFSSEAFKLSQYRLTGQDVVTPRLARDGGSVVFKAGQTLTLDGQLRSQADRDGRGGLVDIAAEKVAIVGAGRDGSDLQAEGFLIVDAGTLSRFGAGSLLVGGTRSGDALGLKVDVTASDIVLRNDVDSALSGPEIILAASEQVTAEAGSVLRSAGQASGEEADLVMAPQVAEVRNDNNTPTNPDDDYLETPSSDWGALVRVSSGRAVRVLRENVDTTSGGRVRISDGVVLDGGAALLIDATNTTEMAAGARLSGTALSVSSGRIGIGGGSGLVLDEAALAQLSQTRTLTLHSYSSLDFHRSLDLSGLDQVVLDAAGLQGHGADTVKVQATKLTLQNTGAPSVEAGTGHGRLELLADELVLGVGDKTVSGFAHVMLSGDEGIMADGSGNLDAGSAALSLRAPVLQGLSGSNQAVVTQGQLTLEQSGDGLDAAALAERGRDSLGARLRLSGQGTTVALPVLALGGSIAVASGAGDLTLTESGSLRAGGLVRSFFDVDEYADGGQISLSSQGGLIDLAAGSLLDVAAQEAGGDAGSLTIDASEGGRVNFAGTLQAQSGAGGRGGHFVLAIDELADFGALAQTLNATGFDQSRQFHIRQGDVTVAGVTRVAAFELITDQGVITIDGTADIDTGAQYGGRIRMVGGQGLTMQSGAVLRARATDTEDGLGSGRITLEAAGGNLHLAGGTLDVSGGEGGKVRLRAQRTADNDGLQVTALNATVQGARSAVLEGMRGYTSVDGTVESVKDQAIGEANAFAGNGGILSGLGDNAAAYTLVAGIGITSDSDLTLGSDWNLSDSFGADHREGTLTLRAGGNLNIDGNLSDGFDVAGRHNEEGEAARLQQAASWDLRLVSGADLDSVDALATQTSNALAADSGTTRVGTADSTVGANDGAGKLVRTGTGDLTLRAGRDLVLAHKESVLYTAGRADADPTLGGGFDTGSVDAQYGIGGGHVDIAARGSVRAPTEQGSRSEQIITEWLLRQGRLGGSSTDPSEFYDGFQIGQEPYQQLPDGSWGNPPIMSEKGQQPSWWVSHADFEQGLGALGGGNVSLSAGGDLVNLVVAQPSNMRVSGGRSATDAVPVTHIRNGGRFQVDAGGAIRAGQYYVGRGAGEIRAGETATGYHLEGTVGSTSYAYDIAPVLALSDASLNVQSAGDLVLQTAIDPLLIRRSLIDAEDAALAQNYRGSADMISQTARTALSLVSVGGDVRLENQADHITLQTAQVPGMTNGINSTPFIGLFPAHTRVAAFDGDIALLGLMPMMTGDTTDLSLLAARDLKFLSGDGPGQRGVGSVVMAMSTLGAPSASSILVPGKRLLQGPIEDGLGWSNVFLTNRGYGGFEDNPEVLPLQQHDFEPSRLYAVDGSITGLDLVASEAVQVRAGTDIRSFTLNARNLRATDVTLLEAGNDILAMTARRIRRNNIMPGEYANRVIIQGPGELVLAAGRDIQAGSLQLFSDGNRLWNYATATPAGSTGVGGSLYAPMQALPEDGANITLMAGMNGTARYDLFEQAYLDPANVAAMPDYLKTTLADGTVVPLYLTDGVEPRGDLDKLTRRGLVSFVQRMLGAERVADLTGAGDGTLTPTQAWEQYQALPELVRQQFLRQVFIYELREGGRDQNQVDAQDKPVNGGYRRGYAAIDTLFRAPDEATLPARYALDLPDDWQSGWRGQGNIAANRMAVRTHQGGDINAFTPGGGLQVAALGATVPDGYGLATLASPGQINLFTDQDIVVNRSRILSFVSRADPLGSDQVLWATLGDIDAGRGAKTVRVGQPPDITADEDGNVTVQEKLDLSGSGIGTVGEGDVDLIAPKGTVNAGDAGIRVAGNFNVAAYQVVNVDNIDVGGESSGLPPVIAVNVGALTSASQAASSAQKAAEEVTRRTPRRQPSIISVEILGYGDERLGGQGGDRPRSEPLSYNPDGAVRILGAGELSQEARSRLTSRERRNL